MGNGTSGSHGWKEGQRWAVLGWAFHEGDPGKGQPPPTLTQPPPAHKLPQLTENRDPGPPALLTDAENEVQRGQYLAWGYSAARGQQGQASSPLTPNTQPLSPNPDPSNCPLEGAVQQTPNASHAGKTHTAFLIFYSRILKSNKTIFLNR